MRSKWQRKKLGEVCQFIGGSQPPKSTFSYDKREGYIRLIQIRDYKSDNHRVYVNRDNAKRFCAADDVMIGRYGPPVFQILRGLEGAYNVALIKAVPDETQLTKDFLFHFLQTSNIQYYIISLSERAAGQSGVNKRALQQYPIDLPPLSEQKRIVKILVEAFAAIDQAKANAEKNLQNSRELFDAYLNKVFANPGDGWEEKKIGEITTKIGSGATPRGGNKSYKTEGVALIRSLNVYDREFRKEKLAFINDEQAQKLSNVTLIEDDVLLNITGASIARCCIVLSEYLPARVNQHVSIIRIVSKTILPKFLNYLLTSKVYKDKLLQTGEKGGATRQALTKSQIENFSILYPPSISEQQKIVSKLEDLSLESQKLEAIYQQKLANLEELKKSILQKAFNGQLKSDN